MYNRERGEEANNNRKRGVGTLVGLRGLTIRAITILQSWQLLYHPLSLRSSKITGETKQEIKKPTLVANA
jgi:hypothetical protein